MPDGTLDHLFEPSGILRLTEPDWPYLIGRPQPPEPFNEVPPMPKTVWRLRGATGKVLKCCVARTASKAHAVTVVLGQETLLQEGYLDETSALSRVRHVRDRLLKGGGWTAVNHAAVGMSST